MPSTSCMRRPDLPHQANSQHNAHKGEFLELIVTVHRERLREGVENKRHILLLVRTTSR